MQTTTPCNTRIETACNAPKTPPRKQAVSTPPRFSHYTVNQALSVHSVSTVAPGALPQNIRQADECRKRSVACIPGGLDDSSSAKKIRLTKEHNDPVINSEDEQYLPANPLFLQDNRPHGRQFNELVRRIEPARQGQILAKLQGINKEHIGIIAECIQDPTYLTGKHLAFFSSEDFPYGVLQAFREEAISLNEFSTLVTVHGVYQQYTTSDPAVQIHYQRLFDEHGQSLQEPWRKIEETIRETDNSCGLFQYSVTDCAERMKECLKSASPLEAGFWYLGAKKPENYFTLTDAVRSYGRCRIFSSKRQNEMIPSLTMRQAFVDAAYGDEAHRVNPAIGDSTPSDIRKGGLQRYRDFQLPFPDHPLPKTVNSFESPHITGFNLYNYYHALISSALPNKYADLYIAMGDEIEKLETRYDRTIDSLKSLCREKLEPIECRLAGMPPEERQVEIRKVEKEIAPIYKLFLSLRSDREAVNQFKCMFYDLEVSEVQLDTYVPIAGLDQEWSFHFRNVCCFLNGFSEEVRHHLRGVTAQIAGRIIMPMIPSAKDLPRKTYASLVSALHRDLGVLPKYRVTGSDGKFIERLKPSLWIFPNLEAIERTLRFINCINTGDIATTLPLVAIKAP